MEKLICGKVTLYRLECPYCGEANLSGSHKFYCTSCDSDYVDKKIQSVRLVAKLQKEVRINAALKKQNNHCFYCEHEFGKFYSKDNHAGKLFPVIDLILPFDLKEELKSDEVIVMCNVCNQYRGHKLQFETMFEEKQWLKYMWTKDIDLGRLNFY